MLFKISVNRVDNPAIKNSAVLTVKVASSPLVASIAGGNRLHSRTRGDGTLVLNGTGSHDPDFVASAATDNQLIFVWKCSLLLSGTALAHIGVALVTYNWILC